MLKIYHNPRCGKSREGLSLVQQSGQEFEIIYYLKDIPTPENLKTLVAKLNIPPIELVRQKEKIWADNFKDKSFSPEELFQIIAEHPILLERPIVVSDTQAVIGRPPEKILSLL